MGFISSLFGGNVKTNTDSATKPIEEEKRKARKNREAILAGEELQQGEVKDTYFGN
jgi:hypothetical protein